MWEFWPGGGMFVALTLVVLYVQLGEHARRRAMRNRAQVWRDPKTGRWHWRAGWAHGWRATWHEAYRLADREMRAVGGADRTAR